MSRISRQDIEMFVGGALAVTGFQSLCAIPDYFFQIKGGVLVFTILVGLVWAVALPIGVSVLLKRRAAIRWAYIFIWAYLILVLFAGFGTLVIDASHPAIPPWWRSLVQLLTPAALLSLLLWSRSGRFQKKPDAS